ncbi:hypothetical protein B0H11DRAFT_2260315 [Mycena galericulata]|nr:hypothetical protein B0H11DRAFT_2260315 [Mycena galericulata]
MSPGPNVRSNTLTPMYPLSKSHIVDLYAVGIEEWPRRASVPFICGIEVEGPQGELERIRALEDDGAMVNVMCTLLYEAIKHRIGTLQRSGKILRMANGTLVPSTGYWEGYIRFGGARVWACFEVFPSGGSWSFLFGKPLLESFGAVHDYATDTITVHGEAGLTAVRNQIGQMNLWDEARGSVHAVFLDPKSRATSAGGSSTPPVRRVSPLDSLAPRNIDQHLYEDLSGVCKGECAPEMHEEAQGNSTGDLPAPSREVQGVGDEKNEDDTDETFFTARKWIDEDVVDTRSDGRTVHTEQEINSDDTRVSGPVAGIVLALRMASVIIFGSIPGLAAQYGGAMGGTMIYLQKNWVQRRRYTRHVNKSHMKLRRKWARKRNVAEPDTEEPDEEDDPRWCYWIPPCTLQFEPSPSYGAAALSGAHRPERRDFGGACAPRVPRLPPAAAALQQPGQSLQGQPAGRHYSGARTPRVPRLRPPLQLDSDSGTVGGSGGASPRPLVHAPALSVRAARGSAFWQGQPIPRLPPLLQLASNPGTVSGCGGAPGARDFGGACAPRGLRRRVLPVPLMAHGSGFWGGTPPAPPPATAGYTQATVERDGGASSSSCW